MFIKYTIHQTRDAILGIKYNVYYIRANGNIIWCTNTIWGARRYIRKEIKRMKIHKEHMWKLKNEKETFIE